MKLHELKTINPHFTNVWDGKKDFEIRKNDRDFKIGDLLWLREYTSCYDEENDCLISGGGYSGREILADVNNILITENTFEGLSLGYIAMGISILNRRDVVNGS